MQRTRRPRPSRNQNREGPVSVDWRFRSCNDLLGVRPGRVDPAGHRDQPARDRDRRQRGCVRATRGGGRQHPGRHRHPDGGAVRARRLRVRGSAAARPTARRRWCWSSRACWWSRCSAVVVAGTQLPAGLIAFRLTPAAVLIAVIWVTGLLLLQRAGTPCPWHESGRGARQPGATRAATPSQGRAGRERQGRQHGPVRADLRCRGAGHPGRRRGAGTQR